MDLLAYLRERVPDAKLQTMPLPLCPEIELQLLSPDYPQHRLTNEQAKFPMQ